MLKNQIISYLIDFNCFRAIKSKIIFLLFLIPLYIDDCSRSKFSVMYGQTHIIGIF